MKRPIQITLAIVVALTAGLSYYLLRPLSHPPHPADFRCLDLSEGHFESFTPKAGNIFGVGLAYSNHINETASDFDPAERPLVFRKSLRALNTNSPSIVQLPSVKEMIADIDAFEPGLGDRLRAEYPELPALLDYETELAFVLLSEIDSSDLARDDFAPALGFFMANDLTARSLAIMGEGQEHREDYWGVGKSFSGFLPVSEKVWIPNVRRPVASIPCIEIETLVNGQQRQKENTSNLIYTPEEMLRSISKKFPDARLQRGDIVLTGTPGGVALATPRWLARLGSLVGMDRFAKLSAILRRDQSAFLKPGDSVLVRGTGLGQVESRIVERK